MRKIIAGILLAASLAGCTFLGLTEEDKLDIAATVVTIRTVAELGNTVISGYAALPACGGAATLCSDAETVVVLRGAYDLLVIATTGINDALAAGDDQAAVIAAVNKALEAAAVLNSLIAGINSNAAAAAVVQG